MKELSIEATRKLVDILNDYRKGVTVHVSVRHIKEVMYGEMDPPLAKSEPPTVDRTEVSEPRVDPVMDMAWQVMVMTLPAVGVNLVPGMYAKWCFDLAKAFAEEGRKLSMSDTPSGPKPLPLNPVPESFD